MSEARASGSPRVASALADVPLVAFMPAEVREVVLASFVRQTFEFGDVIVTEGDAPTPSTWSSPAAPGWSKAARTAVR